ncbi:MAG: NAD(P)H-hydrate epimerase [Deinococcota bacterium]
MNIPKVPLDSLPKLSATQLSQVTMQATGKYGMDMRLLVEHAARNTAELTMNVVPEGPLLVVAGRGHNGGVGLAAARLLASKGRSIWVVPTHEAGNYSGIPKEQLESLDHFPKVRVKTSLPKMKFAGAVDAAVGTKLEGPPRGRTLDVITILNNMEKCCVVSVDVPTGMTPDDGDTPGDVVNATATLSLVYPHQGITPGGAVGDLYVGDLNLPPGVFEDLGIDAPKFKSWLTQVE